MMVRRATPRHHYGMVRVFVFLAAMELALVVLALISSLSTDKPAVRVMPRALWVAVILVVPILGAVAWFLVGRPKPMDGGRAPRGPRGPSSPDDDPDFLRSLDTDGSKRDRELFEKWERDLGQHENGDTDQPGKNGESDPRQFGAG